MSKNDSAAYGSVDDLPSFKENRAALYFLRLVAALSFGPKRRQVKQELKRLKEEDAKLRETAEGFYSLLGPRHWVLTGDLSYQELQEISQSPSPEAAEKSLIDYYQTEGRLEFTVGRLRRFPYFQEQAHLLDRALIDYHAGRFYTTVLTLLPLADGFVNNLDKDDRRGLHTRPTEEMSPWDRVSGHHMGLANALGPYRKQVKKLDTEEVTELYRNGILHGNLPNFDNAIVASRAWNLLFAVTDWADGLDDRERQAEETEAGLLSALRRSIRTSQQWAPMKDWPSHGCAPPAQPWHCPAFDAAEAFLEAWQRKRWDLVAAAFASVGGLPARPEDAKDLYRDHVLERYKVGYTEHSAATAALTAAVLTVDGVTYRTELKWLHEDEHGEVAPEWVEGTWKLAPYGPQTFLKQRWPTRGLEG